MLADLYTSGFVMMGCGSSISGFIGRVTFVSNTTAVESVAETAVSVLTGVDSVVALLHEKIKNRTIMYNDIFILYCFA
jgi:hypothetical protein